jgi:hypothetical protein
MNLDDRRRGEAYHESEEVSTTRLPVKCLHNYTCRVETHRQNYNSILLIDHQLETSPQVTSNIIPSPSLMVGGGGIFLYTLCSDPPLSRQLVNSRISKLPQGKETVTSTLQK